MLFWKVEDGKLSIRLDSRNVVCSGSFLWGRKCAEVAPLPACADAGMPLSSGPLDAPESRSTHALAIPLLLLEVGPSQVLSAIVDFVLIRMVNRQAWRRWVSHDQAMHAEGSAPRNGVSLRSRPVVLKNKIGILRINDGVTTRRERNQHRPVVPNNSGPWDVATTHRAEPNPAVFGADLAGECSSAVFAGKLVGHVDLLSRVPCRGLFAQLPGLFVPTPILPKPQQPQRFQEAA